MSSKEDDEFANAVLLVACVLYVGVIAAMFAGLLVTRPDAGSGLADWAKDYGAIIAGAPVLIAVWVAKQQLEANRRQHVATIKRSFQQELDALEELESFATSIIDITVSDAYDLAEQANLKGLYLPHPDMLLIKEWGSFVSRSISSHAEKLWLSAENTIGLSKLPNPDQSAIRKSLDTSQLWASFLREACRERKMHLSQYWS